jgi:endonuclease YncB( thermonuclease family)
MLVSAIAVFALAFAGAYTAAWLVSRVVREVRRRSKKSGETPTVERSRRREAIEPESELLPFTGKAWVVDGDTLQVKQTRIRLFGMDAPEMSQSGGTRAKSHMIRLAGGKQVRVEPITTDCYGRTVARVRLGEIDLSERMVRDGFAVSDSRWNTDYDSAELYARKNGRGLWAGIEAGGISNPSAHRRQMAALKVATEAPNPAEGRSASVVTLAPRSGPWSSRRGV